MRRGSISLLVIIGVGVLAGSSQALAQVSLGSAQNFAVLGGTTVTNTGLTAVTGDLGVSPGTAVTGFPPGVVSGGAIHAGDATAAQAQTDLTAAYNAAAGTACNVFLTGQDLGGLTLTPGVYCFASSAFLTGTLTLDFQGDRNAFFLFKMGSTIVTASASNVVLTNAGGTTCPPNLFWLVGSSATFGTDSSFAGNVIALTSITMNTSVQLNGRALARNGAVTMDTNMVTACAAPSVCPVVSVNPATLPNGTVGTAYNQTITASGGGGPYTFAVSSGTLPTGLVLSSGGAIAGTPTTAGTFNFTITATDTSSGCVGSRAYTVSIAAPPCPIITLNPATLPPGVIGVPYNQTIAASGGTGPYTFALTNGALPTGLVLSSAGAVSGTPTTAGIFNFTITATDTSSGCVGSRAYIVDIGCPVITVNPATLPNGTVGTPYNQTVTASGATGPYTFAVATGALPAGLLLSSGGAVTGTPSTAGTFNFTITATDTSSGCLGSRDYTVAIACPVIIVNPATLPNGTVGTPYNQTVTASGGTGPYAFAVTSGALPTGLVLSAAGAITGTPATFGTFTFTITATDTFSNCLGSRDYIVVIACPLIIVNPATLPNSTVGTPYNQTITASGGTGPYTFAVTSGALPTGLVLSSAGAITGTPTTGGTFNFTITATDTSSNCVGSRAYTVVIACPVITVNPATLPNGTVGTPYNQTITASGGVGPYTFAVTSGTLPTGLVLSSGGAVTGTPTTAAIFNFTITATDTSSGCAGSQAYTFSIAPACPVITVNPATLPDGTVGTLYNQTVTASGGVGPYTFAVTGGALPPGLVLSSAGAITGTPTTAGTFDFTITATDSSSGCTGSRAYSVSIAAPACPVIIVNPATLPNGTVATPYNQTITASGGVGPYTFALTSGALPTGLALSAAGAITGTPTTFDAFNFTITATDTLSGCIGSRTYNVAVACPVITVNPATLPNGTMGTVYNATITASGGTGPYTFAVTSGTLPTGLALSAAGAITGTLTTPGIFNFTITATDASSGCIGSRPYTVAVACPVITVNPATLPNGIVGTPYNQTITASGGTGPYTFALTSGALPAGLALSAAGVITGTPTVSGTFNFTITATDTASGCIGSRPYIVAVACPVITVNPATLPNGIVGTPYNQAITASGGTGSYTFALTSGALPTGLALSAAGAITGTPTTGGTFNFTIRVSDVNGCPASRPYTIVIAIAPVCPLITLRPSTLPSGSVGVLYNQTIPVSGGAGPFTFAVTNGALPPGLLLDSATGAITGMPTTRGGFSFTVRSTDIDGCFGSNPYSIAISGAASGGPTLGVFGLVILMVLLAGAGLLVMNRLPL